MDFRRWQATVVPITVGYMSAVRRDSVIVRSLPRHRDRSLLASLSDSERTLAGLRGDLAKSAAQLHARPELGRLTTLLERGLEFGQRAQRLFRQGAKEVTPTGRIPRGDIRLKQLRARGIRELQRSQAAMTAFAFGANKLGASLFVHAP